MKHLTEELLIEYRYGAAADAATVEEHLRGCETCRAQSEILEQVLTAVDAAPVPERDASYGVRVWQHLRPRIEARPRADWRVWLRPRRWTPVAAVAVLVMAAFLAGRFWPRQEEPQVAGSIPGQIRERILLVAVGDHLDRTQMVLMELVNADGSANSGIEHAVDISDEQERARDLVASNRLYRQTASRDGDPAVTQLLDELEPVLLEIAHSPSKISSAELDGIRRRIEARGLLFKVRVVGSRVRERESRPMQGRGQTGS